MPSTHTQALASQFSHILSSNPTSLPHTVPTAPSHQSLSILNPEPETFESTHQFLHDFFIQSAASTPSASAFEYLSASGSKHAYTYHDLDVLSSQLKDEIMARGIGQQKIIPVLIPQSPWLYISILAILKAGCAFAPFNLDIPIERARFICKDVDAPIALVDSSLFDTFAFTDAPPIIKIDASNLSPKVDPSYIPTSFTLPTPQSPAYVMYTSGSTGLPKGVLISHHAAVQSLLAHSHFLPPFSRFLQFAAPTFDVSVFEIFFPWFMGKTLIGIDRGRLLADIPGAVREMAIDGAEFTPTVLGNLIGTRDAVPEIKVALTIGEMLTAKVVSEFGFDSNGEGVLQGMYGPTEAAIHCTIAPDFKKTYKVNNIGVPFPTVSAFILHPERAEIMPLGYAGELCVGGPQLADEYLNRPEMNAKVFLDMEGFGRLYRTGDRARFLPDGTIECLGRISSGQVKLRGQRVELGEVEESCRKAEGVVGVVASIVENSLVVFVDGEGITSEQVKQTCRKWLPGYMVPSDVVVLEQLPRLPSGKADRKLLEKQYLERMPEEQEEEDLSTLEEMVQKTVADILGNQNISKSASLAANGLDSILAIRLITALRALNYSIPVAEVLKRDSIEGIAAYIKETGKEVSKDYSELLTTLQARRIEEEAFLQKTFGSDFEKIKGDVEDILPCTAVQEAMLVETLRDSEAYMNWIQVKVPGKYAATQIRTAVEKLIEENEILRTAFAPASGAGFNQVIVKKPHASQFSILEKAEKTASYDLSSPSCLIPPFAARLVRSEAGSDSELHFLLYHALYDGWAWEEVTLDLETLLEGNTPASRPQYREVLLHELSIPSSEKEKAKEFWHSYLSDLSPIPKMPVFHSVANPDVSTPQIQIQRTLGIGRADLEEFAKREKVSPQVVVQAAWALLLSSYLSTSDLLIGTVSSGRTAPIPGLEKILGPTIQTLPLRVNLKEASENFGEVLRKLNEGNRKLVEEGWVGLREVKKAGGENVGFESVVVWQQTTNDLEGGVVEVVAGRDRFEVRLCYGFCKWVANRFSSRFCWRLSQRRIPFPFAAPSLPRNSRKARRRSFLPSLTSSQPRFSLGIPPLHLIPSPPFPTSCCRSRTLSPPFPTSPKPRVCTPSSNSPLQRTPRQPRSGLSITGKRMARFLPPRLPTTT